MKEEPREAWPELVARARRREVEAYAGLVERFRSSVCAVVYPLIRDWHLAQDVAQEAFAIAWRRLHQLREDGSFRGWLFTIARNHAINRLRWMRVRPAQSLTRIRDESRLSYPCGRRAEPVPGAGEEGPVRPPLGRLHRAILALPNEYGALLMMRYVEEMSTEEIAATTGRTPKAVKAALYRARSLARTVLTRAGLTLEKVKDEL